jgi:ribonuclease HI
LADGDTQPVPNWDRKYDVIIDSNKTVSGEGIAVYTDGSLMDGKSGAGASIREEDEPLVTLSENLPDCTVYQAEIRAIQMACEFLQCSGTSGTRITIHVDCQSVLHALKATSISNEMTRVTRDMLNNLAEVNRSLLLQWVKAHAGIEGNEAADKAAKRGGRSKRRRI